MFNSNSLEPKIIQALDEILRRTDKAGKPLPVDREAIAHAHAYLVERFALADHLVEPPSFALRVYHYFKAKNPPEASLLNSFFMGDLATGKTTLLRDIVAATVLDRAMAMAAFDDPQEAFTASGERWTFGGAGYFHLYKLDPSLRGHEILVASSNNKAVENVSRELPAAKAIGRPDELSYFKSISDFVYRPSSSSRRPRSSSAPTRSSRPRSISRRSWAMSASRRCRASAGTSSSFRTPTIPTPKAKSTAGRIQIAA